MNRQVHTALALAIAGGAALTVIGLLISRPVLRLMQTPDEIVGMRPSICKSTFWA